MTNNNEKNEIGSQCSWIVAHIAGRPPQQHCINCSRATTHQEAPQDGLFTIRMYAL
jgi:hypothetical protein